ncbi:hypothetical protein F5146DRAFT_1005833 [Armillaria mellea]|nr:hypothetical protein F5146DRAFT_1005833 [Armillaria mellea]
MVLPSTPEARDASEIALFVTGHPSKEWLAKAMKEAVDGDETGCESLTIIEGDFTGWSIEKLGRYLVDNFADPECPVACGSFAAADEESEKTDSFLLVELAPRYLLRDRTIVIEGTLRARPEYAIGMPVTFHNGTRSIANCVQEPGEIDWRFEGTKDQPAAPAPIWLRTAQNLTIMTYGDIKVGTPVWSDLHDGEDEVVRIIGSSDPEYPPKLSAKTTGSGPGGSESLESDGNVAK